VALIGELAGSLPVLEIYGLGSEGENVIGEISQTLSTSSNGQKQMFGKGEVMA